VRAVESLDLRALGRFPDIAHGFAPATQCVPSDKEEQLVPRIVISHAVQDVPRWLAGKAERADALPGATGFTDLVAIDGSNQAAVAFDFDDLEALKAVMASLPPEIAAQAESHGVIMPMTVYVEA
jgi:muconolactone delta-isomerase